jgi:LysR family hydrogen peroxide-inducible transcriptional activator
MNPQRLPTTKQLRYFVALADTKHFGRAAARCFVSQSAFSTAIQDLESLLDVQLVDRTNRRVAITAQGKEVAVLARLCLQDMQAIVEAAQAHSKPLQGPLRLGVIPTIAPFLLPRVLPFIREEFSALQLYLHEDVTGTLYELLMDGQLDAALLALPYELPGAEKTVLFRDQFLVAAHKGTKLVDPAHYRFNRLNAGSVLLLREGHCMREHAIEACKIRDSQKLASFSATSLLTLIEMVDADLGITFLPEMSVGSALLQSTDIETHPLKGDNYREIALVWRRGSARSNEFTKLGKFIAEHRRGRPD